MPTHLLPGSEKRLPANARDMGEADPGERLEVSVLLRRRDEAGLSDKLGALAAASVGAATLSRADFAAAFGADSADVAAVEAFARGAGLAVASTDMARRTVILSGAVSDFNKAFGVSLRRIEHPFGTFRGRTGGIQIDDSLAGRVTAVLGLDNRPQAQPHFRRAGDALAAAPTAFTPTQIAALYGFPDGGGAGECIALIELGGGFKPADLAAYFAALAITPAPSVKAVSVDHARNAPTGSADGPDGEVMLDIEVAGAVAPKAKIVVYFAPNTDAGFVDAVTTAAHDAVHKPSVISISWGSSESQWTSQALNALNEAIQAAAMMGITVTVASGDNGSSDGVAGADHVDFPASSPFALACGGTSLRAASGAIAVESVWNDGTAGGAGGGGVSAVFETPAWQSGLRATRVGAASAPLAMRGVPDVCGDADPETGYKVRVDGSDTVIGGTSAVAPLWAALITLVNAHRGAPVGFINPTLYTHATALNDITAGDNGDFTATAGWDACTGLGSPKGGAILAALSAGGPASR